MCFEKLLSSEQCIFIMHMIYGRAQQKVLIRMESEFMWIYKILYSQWKPVFTLDHTQFWWLLTERTANTVYYSNCFIHPYDHCVLNLTISFDSFFSLHSNCTRFGILSLYRLSASPFSALLVLIITKWTLFETKNCETTTEKNKANINELGYKFSRHHNSIQF